MLLLGAVSAVAAALSGDDAATIARDIPNIESDLEWHEEIATLATWLSIVLLLLRTHLVFKKQFTSPIRSVYLVLVLIAAGLMLVTGYAGGHLVFGHGAGTSILSPGAFP